MTPSRRAAFFTLAFLLLPFALAGSSCASCKSKEEVHAECIHECESQLGGQWGRCVHECNRGDRDGKKRRLKKEEDPTQW